MPIIRLSFIKMVFEYEIDTGVTSLRKDASSEFVGVRVREWQGARLNDSRALFLKNASDEMSADRV